MKRSLFAIAIASTLVLGGFACNKYEEGPGVSLRGKKGRVANTWVMHETVAADGTVTAADPNDDTEITYGKDGSMSISGGGFSLNGTWEFNDDKTRIITEYSSGGVSVKDTSDVIIKLKNKELWTKDDDNDETHLKAKE